MDARVTVVMATRDRRRQALETLAHLAALPERPSVVVVDNASADGSAEALAQHPAAPRVVRLRENRGAAARTVGVALARTPYVAFSDDDSWWAPGALTRAADLFDAHCRLGVVAARVCVGPQRRLDPVCAEMAASPLPRPPDLPGPAVLGFVACGAVVRRSAYLEVGGFHPLVFFPGEETALALDLDQAGWHLAYVDAVEAVHHPAPARDVDGRRRLEARSELVTVWLRRPLGVALGRTMAVVAAARRDPARRAAVVDLARVAPAVWAGRRPVTPELEARVRLLETAAAPSDRPRSWPAGENSDQPGSGPVPTGRGSR